MMDQKAMDQVPPASLELESLGIPHRVFRHAGVITSLEQAAEERGQHPEQVVRSILFRLGHDRFIMVLARGAAQIPWKKLRQQLSQNRLTLATEEEVLRITGYAIGTVSPFGVHQPVPIYVDHQILAEDQISIGSGLANTGIVMRSQDLLRALRSPEFLDLVRGD
jgi:prolyl-tRNA editing enzyme YbaK/EbsC (Cys-tRNA(Pro) deacylase)